MLLALATLAAAAATNSPSPLLPTTLQLHGSSKSQRHHSSSSKKSSRSSHSQTAAAVRQLSAWGLGPHGTSLPQAWGLDAKEKIGSETQNNHGSQSGCSQPFKKWLKAEKARNAANATINVLDVGGGRGDVG